MAGRKQPSVWCRKLIVTAMTRTPVEQPNLSRTAFWDVDFAQLDFEADSLLVMSKVFNYGRWTDILEVFKYYGLERVKQEIVQAAYLKKTVLSFLCVILDLTENDFTAYQRRQERKPVWEH